MATGAIECAVCGVLYDPEYKQVPKTDARSVSVNANAILIVALALLIGVAVAVYYSRTPSPESVVRAFLDSQVKREKDTSRFGSPHVLGEVTDYSTRGYEIKNVSGETVSATIIFASKAGTDLPKTHVFTVHNGEIVDIR